MRAQISRRSLLVGAAAVGLGLPKALGQDGAFRVPPGWAGVRALFELDPTYVHMAGLLLASHPEPVRKAIELHRAALDRNPAHTWEELNGKGEDSAREAAARYLNGSAADVALTDSTTMGLALLYGGLSMKPGQETLSTTHDHFVTERSLQLRSERTGNPVRRVALYDEPAKANAEEMVGRLAAAIRPETRAIAVTHVHSGTGVRLPIGRIAEAVRKANEHRSEEDRALLCVDAVHGLGSTAIDLQTFGADFLCAGCHKWLFGPRGTGILWGRAEAQKFVTPSFPSLSGMETWGKRMTPGGFHSFEHRWALDEAFALHRGLRAERVERRIHDLNRQVKEELAKMPKVRLYTPQADELSAGLVCFDVEGMPAREVVARLRERRIIASQTPYAVSYARLTPSLLNDEGDLEKTLAAVRDLAA